MQTELLTNSFPSAFLCDSITFRIKNIENKIVVNLTTILFSILLITKDYLITLIHPSGASICPIWIPVKVSYNFWMTGPIFSIPLGKQISLP